MKPKARRVNRWLLPMAGVLALAGLSVLSGPVGTAAAAEADDADRVAMAVEALSRLQGVDLSQNAKLKETVLKVLEKTRGTAHFVKLVKQFNLTDQNAGLLEVAVRNPADEAGVEAIKAILASKDFSLLQNSLRGTNLPSAIKTAEALGHAAENQAAALLLPLVPDLKRDVALRKQAVRALAQTSEGAAGLLQLAREEKLPEDVKFTASSELSHARWPAIQSEAARVLPLPQGQNAQPLPVVSELLKMKGDPANGEKIFARETVGCATCHQVNGKGVDFGPNLSGIGGKLGRDALVEAILDPSAGVSFGYEAWTLQLKSGDDAYGLIVSETADEVAMKAVGGIVTRLKKGDIKERQQSRLSIMPAGLQQTITPQELMDLVEYLASLKTPVAGK